MSRSPATASSPPLRLVAPFFLVAPAGLVAAGLLLAGAGGESLVAVNTPRNVAITHALVVGWVTTTIMGASYQLVPVVAGGPLWSERLARFQLWLHVAGVAVFVWALRGWHITVIGLAGPAVFLSLLLYVVNVAVALARGKSWTLPRAYLAVSLSFLVLAMSVGVTYTGALQPAHAWFPITFGRLSAHAHLGLAGWLALTVMGVSYQLVPMFNVVNQAKPRLGWAALAITALGVAAFAAIIATDPGPGWRLGAALALAAGPVLWGADTLRLMRARSRRRLDVQGRATFAALAFLALTIVLGLGAALGTPLTSDAQPARWLVAYAAAGIGGWAGVTLVGNSFKILPFLIWYHRYRPRAGRVPVPVTADIYSERAANAVLALQCSAVALVAAGALAGSLTMLRTGGALLAVTGCVHALSLLHMFLPKNARARVREAEPAVAS